MTENKNQRRDDQRPATALRWDDAAIKQMQDVMLDLETAGTAPGCAILTIGAVTFGPAGLGNTFYAAVSLASATALGLTIDPDTIAWWMKQSEEARAAAFQADGWPLVQVLRELSDWFAAQGAVRIWSHGASFDVPIIEVAYRAASLPAPWKFWDVRDTRTLYDLAGVKPDRSQGMHHNALDDARAQAEAAVTALQLLAPRAQAGAPADPAGEMLDMLGRIHPFAMEKADREKAYERLERAYCIQQPWPVPDQACIVWRADLMDMRYDLVHKQAVFESWKRERADRSPATRDVLAERLRQVEKEGHAHEEDDAYVQGELGAYAAFYAMPPGAREWPAEETGYGATWGEAIIPADWTPPKPGARRCELVKAGALILAEIERLDRAAASAGQEGGAV